MDERELKKEYVMYLRDNKLEHLDCEMLFEMIKYFEGLGKNKYDEALERARRILCNVPEGSASARDIETIFPDLRESEDERMMREFNDWLCEEIECRTNDLRDEKDRRTLNMLCYVLTKVKNWLEKQKEQPKEELVYRLNGLMQDYIKEGKDDEEKEHRLKCYQLFWDALEDTSYFEQKEQKPAEWNANDKAIVNCIVCCLDGQFVPEAARKQSLEWFNKHRRDFLNQTEQEWSEEDERIRKAILGFLNPDKGGTKYSSYAELVEWSDWLKSLRPSWKPNEEQIAAFKGYIEDFQARAEAAVGGWNNFDVMIRLYEQLKKL